MTPRTIDRSGCSARRHGTAVAYDAYKCRCPDAREAHRIYRKRIRHGRITPGPVSTIGSSRRLQALSAIGWTLDDLVPHCGLTRDTLRRIRSRIQTQMYRSTAARIRELYDELSGTVGPSQIARDRARAAGWAPPLAWDDDTIDDPDAQPDLGERPPKQQGIDLDEVAHLEAGGVSLHEIAKRLNVKIATLKDANWRARRKHRRAHSGGESEQVAP